MYCRSSSMGQSHNMALTGILAKCFWRKNAPEEQRFCPTGSRKSKLAVLAQW